MQRELSSFPFPSQQRAKLHNAGFITAEDVLEMKPTELSKELNVSKPEALEIIQLVRNETDRVKRCAAGASSSSSPNIHKDSKSSSDSKGQRSSSSVPVSLSSKTALDLLNDEQLQQSIITFSEKLDSILGGGIPLGKITEICGAPGVGKTQFSIQLSVDVQIPQCFGGVDGEAVYIDTEGSFIVDRVADIATATIKHCQYITDTDQNHEQVEKMKSFGLESILGGIHYFRCHDYIELLALTHTLSEFIQEHPKIKLIVLDSVAFPFRHDFEDFSLRTRLLNGLAQSFIKMATEYKLAVLLTNQMTTKISSDPGQSSHLIPALGESWGHASTVRLILYWHHNRRHALLYKSPSHRETTVAYQITTGGIRDINHNNMGSPETSSHGDTTVEHQPKKRPRMDSR